MFSEGLSQYLMEFLPDLQYLGIPSQRSMMLLFCHVVVLRLSFPFCTPNAPRKALNTAMYFKSVK